MKLDFGPASCVGSKTLEQVLDEKPAPDSVMIRVRDMTNTRVYGFQAIHAMPYSVIAEKAKRIDDLGAALNQVLTWNGTEWVPMDTQAASGGSAPTGAAGGDLDGTYPSPVIRNGAITIAKTNFADGSIPVAKIGGLGDAATRSIPLCGPGEVLTSDVIVGFTCVADTSADPTKLPLSGGMLTGPLELAVDPVNPLEAATKQYVDNKIAGDLSMINESQWGDVPGGISYNSGNVGIGTSSLLGALTVSGSSPRVYVQDTTGAVDQKKYFMMASAGQFGMYSETDGGGGQAFFAYTNTTNSVFFNTNSIGVYGGQVNAHFRDLTLSSTGAGPYNINLLPAGGGNVGVGTNTPSAKLEVAGQVKITGGNPGANKILTSDAAGLASWTDPPTGLAPTGAAGGDLSGTYPNPTIRAGVVSYDKTNFADGSIPQAKVAGLVTDLSAKEPLITAGTSAQFLNGLKAWTDFGTTVRATPLTGFTVGANSAITATDSTLQAFGKTQGQIDALGTSVIANASKWSTATGGINYAGGRVGIGTSAPGQELTIQNTDKVSSNLVLQSQYIAISANDVIGGIDFNSNDSQLAAPLPGARVQAIGEINSHIATNIPTALTFSTVPNLSTTLVERLRISSSGNVGIGTAVPTTKLHIAGSLTIGNGGEACTGGSFAGALRYNAGAVEFCNGTAWTAVAASGGSTPGDNTVTSAKIVDGTIVDADVAAGAAIAQSKIANLTTDLAGKQASDSDLTALSGLAGTGVLVRTGDGTATTRTIDGTVNRVVVTNGTGVAGNPSVNISTSLLPSPLAGDANKFLKASGADASSWQALASGDVTAALGFTPINKAGETISSGIFNFNAASVIRVLPPIGLSDVANKQYVDDQISGAANQWSQASGNVYRSSGNVGIGTASPVGKLHVEGVAVGAPALMLKGNLIDGGNLFHIDFDRFDANDRFWRVNGSGVNGQNIIWTSNVGTSAGALDSSFMFGSEFQYNQQGISRIFVNTSGNVGVGTTSPGGKFSVVNGGQVFNFGTGSNSSGYVFNVGLNDDGINMGTGSTIRGFNFINGNGTLLKVTPTGSVGVSTATPRAKFEVNNGANSDASILATSNENNRLVVQSYDTQPNSVQTFGIVHNFNGDENNGFLKFFRGGSSNGGFMTLGTSGVERVRVTPAGNVGVGTTTPASKLTVAGTIESTSGGVKFPDGSVQTTAAGMGNFQKGVIGSCAASSAGSSGSVTFPTAFAGTPIVQMTVVELDDSGCTSVRLRAISATGFSWNSWVGGSLAACDCIHWTAFY